MAREKRVRIIKKIRDRKGHWKFVTIERVRHRYVWDNRPGYYFLEWWDGPKRRRERAGLTPSETLESQRRKRNELIGELLSQGKLTPSVEQGIATPIPTATRVFLDHVKAHSPEKPETVRRYQQVLGHFDRILGRKKYVEAVTRGDIDTYKIERGRERSPRHGRRLASCTVNFEVSVIRTFFNYLVNDRGINMTNPCLRFKRLKDGNGRTDRPSVYSNEELGRLLATANPFERAVLPSSCPAFVRANCIT